MRKMLMFCCIVAFCVSSVSADEIFSILRKDTENVRERVCGTAGVKKQECVEAFVVLFVRIDTIESKATAMSFAALVNSGFADAIQNEIFNDLRAFKRERIRLEKSYPALASR